jgi:hypothetical protein
MVPTEEIGDEKEHIDCAENNSILLAVNNTGKSVHDKVAALIISINDPSVQVLFEGAEIIITTLSHREEFTTSDEDGPILPQVLFQEADKCRELTTESLRPEEEMHFP